MFSFQSFTQRKAYKTNKPYRKQQRPKNEAKNKENENSFEQKHYETNLFGNIN